MLNKPDRNGNTFCDNDEKKATSFRHAMARIDAKTVVHKKIEMNGGTAVTEELRILVFRNI
ncbi:hypothetical protein QWY86_02805 [Pedobacter aquatilis]|uniref:hypothetical protein n=1 Tax=Pedobacter aquatilis TaxID=351343 RepID=UPI0025B4A409|nr:hypothetical protein [Pedobacter aquatilis]MDN3585582.1 hypothetical protein [Pedobacter aquatilis]